MGKLQALAPVVFLGPTTPADWRTLGEQFADAANVSDSYGAFIEQYDERAQEISKKYQDKLGGLKFAGVCSMCFPDPGEFVREYKSSYVTNLFDDLGLQFPGQPDNPEDGHAEYVAFERISDKLGDADVIVYGVELDGSVTPEMQELMASPLWQNLPAVKAGNLVPVKHAQAAPTRPPCSRSTRSTRASAHCPPRSSSPTCGSNTAPDNIIGGRARTRTRFDRK